MDNKTYSIGILSVTAVVLLVANFMATPPVARATQGFAAMGQDYQVVSAPEQSGGDALYVLNNRTGMLAVFTYEAAARQMVPRVVTPITAAFPTAGATGTTTGSNGMTPRQR